MACGEEYGSHDWQWVGGQRMCSECGVEDLGGRRLVARVLEGLREHGWTVRK